MDTSALPEGQLSDDELLEPHVRMGRSNPGVAAMD